MWWSYFCLSVVMVGVKARVKKEEQQTATNIMVENIWDYLNDFLTLLWIVLHQVGVRGIGLVLGSAISVLMVQLLWMNLEGNGLTWLRLRRGIFSSRKARNSGEFVSAYNRPQRIRFIVNICKLSNCWKFLLSRGRLSEVPMTLKLTEDRNLVLFLGFVQLQMIWQVHKGLHV